MPDKDVSPGPRRYRVDLALFVAAVTGGVVAIVALKSLGFAQWVATAVPVGIILGYAALVAFVPRFRLRADRAGDSCYYLGFLFTLTSLGGALFRFTLDESQIQVLITNFGIALATTIAGMALRVLFSQFREDPVEIEREARIELGEAVSRFRAELDNAVVELNNYRRATQQAYSDSISELFDQHRDILARHVGAVDKSFVGAAERFEATSVEFAERTRSVNNQAGTLARRLEALVERIEAVD